MNRVARLTAIVCGASTIGACSTKLAFEKPEPGWERMQLQPRANAYDASDFFADGKVMQTPPEGAVARETTPHDPGRETGLVDGQFVDHLPLPVDRAFIARGRDRYDVFCAPCHGVAGDGESVVATKMTLRKPPSLVDPPQGDSPAGEIYRAISEGFGLMPSYQSQLSNDERWAVVAYVRALRLSRRAVVDELPAPVRLELEQRAP